MPGLPRLSLTTEYYGRISKAVAGRLTANDLACRYRPVRIALTATTLDPDHGSTVHKKAATLPKQGGRYMPSMPEGNFSIDYGTQHGAGPPRYR